MNCYENLLKPLTVPSHRSTPSSLLSSSCSVSIHNVQLGLITVVIIVRAMPFP